MRSRSRARAQLTRLWWPARWQLAAVAVGVAVLTGAGGAALGDEALGGAGLWNTLGTAHVLVTLMAIRSPQLLWIPVGTGLTLSWGVVAAYDGADVLLVLPVVIGVVVTAELLGLVARLGLVIERDPGPDLLRLGVTSVLATGAGAVVLTAGAWGGPGGLAAAVLAVGASVALALLLVDPGPG